MALEAGATSVILAHNHPSGIAVPSNDDISTTQDAYSGDKYDALKDAGFNLYFGFCADGTPWATVSNTHVRLGRIMVTGKNLINNASWFAGMFDAATVLDTARN